MVCVCPGCGLEAELEAVMSQPGPDQPQLSNWKLSKMIVLVGRWANKFNVHKQLECFRIILMKLVLCK